MKTLSPKPEVSPHVTICFEPDGQTRFYPEGDPEEIARRLARLITILHKRPGLAKCAAGVCRGRCGHASRRGHA